MADDKSKSKPKSDKKPSKPGQSGPSGPPVGGPPMAGGGPPPMGGDPMSTGMGVQPPMPGSGMDPYAALAGQISNISPMGQPAMPGFGGGGMPPGGGMGGGMGGPGDNINGLMPPGGGMGGGMGAGAGGAALQGGPPGGDPLQAALMSSAAPMSTPPDQGETWLDPEGQQQQLSLNDMLTMLALMQGGIPSSGAGPMGRPGSVSAGTSPVGMGGGF